MTKFTTQPSVPGLRPEVLIALKSEHTTSKKKAESKTEKKEPTGSNSARERK